MLTQIQYEGYKRYTDDSGIDQTLIDKKKDANAAKETRTLYIDELIPKTVYTFNISAKFMEGTWGPPYTLHVETSIDGQSP